MSKLDGYAKFEKLMADYAPSFIGPLVKKKLNDESFFSTQEGMEFIIFNGFSEISDSINTLKLIETFIKTNPPKENGINYSNYLTYHVHNYLQEMYILKERLTTYSKKIKRSYSKVIQDKMIKDMVESLMKIILDALNGVTGLHGARNKHVHAKKFKDEELNWLSSSIFLADFNYKFRIESEHAYLKAKAKWSTRIETNNRELDQLIDMFFNTMYGIISVNEKVVLPDEYIRASNNTLERNSLP